MSQALRRLMLFTALTFPALSSPAAAQEVRAAPAQSAPQMLGRLTLFADRQGRQVLDIPANVTVVDGEEIEAQGVADMQQLVRTLPGVSVDRQTSGTDPFNTFGGFNIRGVGGNRVQILVDGSRTAERIIDGTRDYLDFSFTRQVDVVRGPASVLWGADALGGVVAVETIGPEDVLQGRMRGGQARLSFSSLDRSGGAEAVVAQRVGDTLGIMLGLSRRQASEPELRRARSDGGIYGCPRNIDFGATDCGSLDPTDVESNRLLFKLEWTPSAEHRLEFSIDALRRRTDVRFDQVLGPVFGMTGAPTGEVIAGWDRRLDISRNRFGLRHEWTPEAGPLDRLQTTLAFTPHGYSRSGIRRSTNADGEDEIRNDLLDYDERFLELDVQAERRFVTGSLTHELTFGFQGDIARADYQRIDRTRNLDTGIVTETRGGGFNFANATTRRADIYSQNRITFGASGFELTPGLRYATYRIRPRPDADYQPVAGAEPVTRSDTALLASLGAQYRFDDRWSIWAKYGEGFKMPTAQQLYTSLPGAFFNLIPAPDLRPERVRSVELGVRGQFDRGFLAVNAFEARYKDFIDPFFNIPGTSDFTYRNLSAVRTWGLEASGAWDFTDRLTGTASIVWQRGRQRATPEADRTPQNLEPLKGVFRLSYAFPDQRVTLDLVGTAVGRVRKTSTPDGFRPSGYGLIDTYLRWDVTETATLTVGVQNLFDRRYFQPGAIGRTTSPSAAVARTNPLELQTGPGRVFTAGLTARF